MTGLLEYRIDDKRARDILDFLTRRARCDSFRFSNFMHIDNQLCQSFILIPDLTEKSKFSNFLAYGVNLHYDSGLPDGMSTVFLPYSEDMHVKFLSRILKIAETSDIWFYAGHGMIENFLDKGETLESVLMSRDLHEGILENDRKSRDN